MVFAASLALIIIACIAAPLWASGIAGTGPVENHVTASIVMDGVRHDVVSLDGTPIGPTWSGHYLLGADPNGRDVAVRVLYAGRNSLLIGGGAAMLTIALATILGLAAGYLGGRVDTAIMRALDVVWAFPVLLFAVAFGTLIAVEGFRIGPLSSGASSKLATALVIGVVSVPYVTRPVRAAVLAMRRQPFVEAAVALGAGDARIMVRELLPNLSFTLLALFSVLVANAIVLEAALSFLGAGVRAPESSWGSMLRLGLDRFAVSPHLLVVPSVALTLAVLCVNLAGDAVRRALDPHAFVPGGLRP